MPRPKLPPKLSWTQRDLLRRMDQGKTLAKAMYGSFHIIGECCWPSWPTIDALTRRGLIEATEEKTPDGEIIYRRVPGTEYR